MRGLINDILDTAEVDSGEMQIFEETVDLEDRMTSALRLLAPLALAGVVHFLAQLPLPCLTSTPIAGRSGKFCRPLVQLR